MGAICISRNDRGRIFMEVERREHYRTGIINFHRWEVAEESLRRTYAEFNHFDGLCLILMNKTSKKYFSEFIVSRWDETWLYPIEDVQSYITLHMDSIIIMKDETVFLDSGIGSVIFLIYQDFPRSTFYENWRCMERSKFIYEYKCFDQTRMTTIPDIQQLGNNDFVTPIVAEAIFLTPTICDRDKICVDATECNYTSFPTATELPQQLLHKSSGDTATDVIEAVDYLEIGNIMKRDSSLFLLLCTVENMPVSFSLATASPTRHGFPLIYTNKQFERLTGYARSEVLGKNAKFLQSRGTHERSLEQTEASDLALALRNFEPITRKMINFRKNGTPYHCVVFLTPIFDEDDTCIYVASFQLDISGLPSLEMNSAIVIIMALGHGVPVHI